MNQQTQASATEGQKSLTLKGIAFAAAITAGSISPVTSTQAAAVSEIDTSAYSLLEPGFSGNITLASTESQNSIATILSGTSAIDMSEVLNTPVNPTLVFERIISEIASGKDIDEKAFASLLDPEILGWAQRTVHGQILANTLDAKLIEQEIAQLSVTELLELALSYGNQGTDATSCSTVEDQLYRSSGMFAKDLKIQALLSGGSRQDLAQAMCESTVSGTLEKVVAELGYEITDDTIIFNLFGSGKNPDGTDGGVGFTYRIAKGLEVTNAYITSTGELVANFVACGGNFGIITDTPEIIIAYMTPVIPEYPSLYPQVNNIPGENSFFTPNIGGGGSTFTPGTPGTPGNPETPPHVSPVPVPPSGFLLLAGLVGLGGFAARFGKKSKNI